MRSTAARKSDADSTSHRITALKDCQRLEDPSSVEKANASDVYYFNNENVCSRNRCRLHSCPHRSLAVCPPKLSVRKSPLLRERHPVLRSCDPSPHLRLREPWPRQSAPPQTSWLQALCRRLWDEGPKVTSQAVFALHVLSLGIQFASTVLESFGRSSWRGALLQRPSTRCWQR